MKCKYSFTIEDRLMDWFRLYVREESTTMSAVLNQHILNLKRNKEGYTNSYGNKPKLKVIDN